MRILQVADGSPAARAGVRTGDELRSVNGHPMRDALDYLFAISEGALVLELERGEGPLRRVRLTRSPGEALGLELAPDRVRRCSNRCIFCFIDQNPLGLRANLYVKDEDYRLSLLYGNYLSLTNLQEWEIRRILEQRLSPLYVSVHAVDPVVRRRMLGCRGEGAILPILRRLAAGGIRLHAQIVLVPAYNDGAVLDETLEALESLHPAVQSVAVVPVGLTRHRDDLPRLRRVTPRLAAAIIARVERRQRRCLSGLGTRLHFLADEFYLLAGRKLPQPAGYEGFPQIENGVGMVRRFERELRRLRRLLPAPGRAGAPRRGRRPRAVTATGVRFAPILATRLAAKLRDTGESDRWQVEVLPVRNRLFGASVNVAGLLGGAEVASALRRRGPFELAVLPPEMFNTNGLTLDGMRLEELAHRITRPVRIGLGGRAPEAR